MIGNGSRHGIFACMQSAGVGGYGVAWVQNLVRLGTFFPILKKIGIC
jgi:hypothetical protein